ncbi:helix-turn-helix domain-containing protein [Cupriavidus basilensis]|uniref:helix-turn-helix domain-containing protein n=1 Tax=Cupriavidus basilensis TaxID=68895 RepID=UPI0039F6B5B4
MKSTKPLICEALRLIRVYHDMTQTELASKTGISVSTISMLESGQRQPSIEMLRKYAAHFDVPLSSILFFGEQLEFAPIVRPVSRTIAKKIIQILNWVADRTAQGNKP